MKPLVKRSITGIVFLIIVILGLSWQYTYAALMITIIVLCTNEYLSMTISRGFKREKRLSICAGIIFFALALFVRIGLIAPKFLLLSAIPYFAICAILLFKKELIRDKSEDKSAALFAPLLYIVLPFTLSLFLTFSGDGSYSGRLMLFLFILIWSSDVGAYIFGMSFGQKENSKKLAPEISPKKSIAGLWGGIFVTLLAAVLLSVCGFWEINLYHSIAIGVVVSIFEVIGDLFESLLKRHYSLKDSGSIMPGHGGLLDRFDGALFVIPAVVIYLKLFSLI